MSEISLRELLETKIKALEDRIETQKVSDQRALTLQAKEYERRLEILNGEHSRVANIVRDKVDRTEWDEYHKRQLAADYIGRMEFSAFKEQQVSERSRAIGEVQGKARVTALVYSIVGMGTALASVVIAFFLHK